MTKILLVGEAWGAREERFEHAFVGPSGAELARMLAQVGLAPELGMKYPSELDMIRFWRYLREDYDIDIGNVFNVHPPANNIDLCFTSSREGGLTSLPAYKPGKYLRPEFLPQVEALWAKVAEAKPNLVVAFGYTSYWSLMGTGKIGSVRGTIGFSDRHQVKVLPTFHPAYILRQWNLRTIVLSDLEKARREAETAHVKRVERFVLVEPTIDDIAEWLQRPAEYYAADIETYRTQISMIGFARSPQDAIVIPFYDERKPTGSYWSEDEEVLAWKLADTALKKPVPKIFQNGVFDLFHMLRAGLRPTMCGNDTMLLHHALYPEMLKGLGFLGSIYSNEQAWKQMRGKGNTLKRDE